MLELLNQLDGFDTRGDVKVIMATNKVRSPGSIGNGGFSADTFSQIDSLDPALIRPGRIDRKIGESLPFPRSRPRSANAVLSHHRVPASRHQDEASHLQASHRSDVIGR